MTGHDVTFKEFVQYVLETARRGYEHIDHHWRPQYNLCHPCHIKYDFIGHYETLHQDAEHVLRQISRLSNNTDVQFPATDLDSRNRNSRGFLRKFYGDISSEDLRGLLQLYKSDYEIFGYDVPDIVRRNQSIYSEKQATSETKIHQADHTWSHAHYEPTTINTK